MPTVDALLAAHLTVKETFSAAEAPAAGGDTINHAGFNVTQQLKGSTSPPATMVSAFRPALVAGAASIDLTALPKTGGGAQSASGLKVRALLFRNPGANGVAIQEGASDGYELNGGDDLRVPAGGALLLYFADGLAAIDATHKILDLAGTGTDVFDCLLLLG